VTLSFHRGFFGMKSVSQPPVLSVSPPTAESLQSGVMEVAARSFMFMNKLGKGRTPEDKTALISSAKDVVKMLGTRAPQLINSKFDIQQLNSTRLYQEANYSVQPCPPCSRTLLQLAVCTADSELVQILLDAGAAPDGLDPAEDQLAALTLGGGGVTPLNIMAQWLGEVVRELVATTVRESTDTPETSRWTGAHDYLFEYALIAQALIRAGARVDLTLKIWEENFHWLLNWQKAAMKGVNATYDAIGSMQTQFKRLGLHVKTDISVANDKDETQGYPHLAQHVQSLKRQLASDALRPQSALGGSNNMLLVGNFGVGKRTAVQLFAKELHGSKRINSSAVITRRGADILNTFMRPETDIHSLQSMARLPDGFMGVLFIEEAAKMLLQEGDLKTNVVDALMAAAEARPDVTIALGVYPNNLNRLKQAIPGMISRFPWRFDMADFTPEDVSSMLHQAVHQKGLQLSPEVHTALISLIRKFMANTDAREGNAHTVSNMLTAALRRQAVRLHDQQTAAGAAKVNAALLTLDDFAGETAHEDMDEETILKQLDDFTGLDRVKKFVRSLYSTTMVEKARISAGFPPQRQEALHMIFKGNPGTGKTSFAKILAQLFRKMGLVSRGQLIEAKRADLVAGYLGQTAHKTYELIQSARGGVLFIDEAYGLVNDKPDPYGEEALTTLLEAMETHRSDLVVILAGYTSQMEGLLKKNPGLPSRFPHQVVFSDFTPEELLSIVRRMIKARELKYASPEVETALTTLVMDQRQFLQQGNARSARNMVDSLIREQSRRLMETDSKLLATSPLQLKEITIADIKAMEKAFVESTKAKSDLKAFIL
jgi:Holliday junction resolvasome RuvABC ATP-dependent DNA helicase subunit